MEIPSDRPDLVQAAITAMTAEPQLTPSPNPDLGLVRESWCPGWGLKGFSDEDVTQHIADLGLASAG